MAKLILGVFNSDPSKMRIPFEWCVDSVNGSDSNDGRGPYSAFRTIAKLMTVMQAGDAVGLAAGSHWREQLDLPGNSCRVGTYSIGYSDRPILDCSEIVPAGGWSKTGGRVNVYEAGITPEWRGTSEYLNVWEDDAFLARATDVANCDATPGSYYPSSEGAGTITLYIHPNSSTDPTSDGKTYEYSHRQRGLDCESYSSCIISGVHGKKPLSNSGAVVLGPSSQVSNCRSSQGGVHNFYMRTGCILTDCLADEFYQDSVANSFYILNENNPASEGATLTRCIARNSDPTLESLAVAFYSHKNVAGTFGDVYYNSCSAEGCAKGVTASDVDDLYIDDFTAYNCREPFSPGNTTALNWHITGGTITSDDGLLSRSIVNFGYGSCTMTISGLTADIDDTTWGLFRITTAGQINLTVTNSEFTMRGASVSQRDFLTLTNVGTGHVIDFSYCSFVAPNLSVGPYIYNGNPVGWTLTSDNNCFEEDDMYYRYEGSNYATLALWQAGESLDLNSDVGGCT